jgi:predicted transcriptional regulator
LVEKLTDSQKKSIEKGIDDIKNGRTFSHDEAKQKIRQYLLEKSK